MAINSQMLEILGWLLITLVTTFPAIIAVLRKPKIQYIYLLTFLGFLIGSLLLYYSNYYGFYAFSFLIFWIFRLLLLIIIWKLKENLLISYIVLSDYGAPIITILFGLYFQTKIWFITTTLVLLVVLLQYLALTFNRSDKSNSDDPGKKLGEISTDFLPGLIIPFASVFYLFNIGILDSETLTSFYGIFIQGFFALIGIIAMFSLFILERIEVNKDYFSKLFKGLIVLYIFVILVLTLGLITTPQNLDAGYIDLSYDALVPDIPIKERQLADSSQIFEEIIFTISLGLLLCSLAYLYKIVVEILDIRKDLDNGTSEIHPDDLDLSENEIRSP